MRVGYSTHHTASKYNNPVYPSDTHTHTLNKAGNTHTHTHTHVPSSPSWKCVIFGFSYTSAFVNRFVGFQDVQFASKRTVPNARIFTCFFALLAGACYIISSQVPPPPPVLGRRCLLSPIDAPIHNLKAATVMRCLSITTIAYCRV